MCGRFTQSATWAEVQAFTQPLTLREPEEMLMPSWNVAPSQRAYVIGVRDDALQTFTPKWGFAPSWAKGNAPINARLESAANSPMFRGAFAKARCVVPANGWFEWKVDGEGRSAPRTPYYFEPVNTPLLYLAGIRTGDSFAILTTGALLESADIHDRSPALIAHADLSTWLAHETPVNFARELALTSQSGLVRAREVDRAIGNPRNNGPGLLD